MSFENALACRLCPGVSPGSAVLGPANGPVPAAVVFVGEAPGRFGAARTGVPFQGDASGRRFDLLLASAGLRRGEVFITNAVLCLPLDARGRNRTPRLSERRACRAHLVATLDLVQPAIVVAMGAVALSSLDGIERHGVTLRSDVGTVVCWRGVRLLPLYHPGRRAGLHRSWADQLRDWERLGRLVREPDYADDTRRRNERARSVDGEPKNAAGGPSS